MLQRMERRESVSTDGDECPVEDARKGKRVLCITTPSPWPCLTQHTGCEEYKGGKQKDGKKEYYLYKRDFLARERVAILPAGHV